MAANHRDVISLKELSITPYNVITELTEGSTGPLLVMNNEEQYVLKFSNSPEDISDAQRNAHAANEYLAFMLYDAAFLSTPPVIKLVQDAGNNRIGVLESYIEGDTLANILYPGRGKDEDEKKANTEEAKRITFPIIQNDLLVHALLGNWDINNNQNIMIPKNDSGKYEFDNPIVIDCGGTLFFRAQGKFKEDFEFTKNVSNINSLIRVAAKAKDPKQKPLKNLKYTSPEDLQELICSNWNKEKGNEILAALDRERPIVEPYYTVVGKSYDELKRILTERIEFINDYCKSNESSGSGGSGASASASSGGKRRKTRKHKHRVRKTRRHIRR